MKKLLVIVFALLMLAAAGYGGLRLYLSVAPKDTLSIPTAAVNRGDVTFTVTAKGDLIGGKSEMLVAPMIGGSQLVLTYLLESGELVEEGDVVAKFDTTEQEFNLKEAEADLAEAEQQVIQAQANSEATTEEARMALVQARADLKWAELDARQNPTIAPIKARQKEIAVNAAKEKIAELEKDLPDKISTAKSGIAIQQAGQMKARMMAEMARRNMEMMTLKAKSGGYVARQPNLGMMIQYGTYIQPLQVGDTVRSGMPVVQIPDLSNWEMTARMSELDRAHIAEGQQATITVVALAGRTFKGHVKTVGGTGGPFWDRYAEARIAIDDPAPELRPGMSARAQITTQVMKNALWIRSQALFESDGRKFVYLQTPSGFTPADVKLVQRSESQAVIEGLKEGQMVALASPDQMKQQTPSSGGALKAMPNK